MASLGFLLMTKRDPSNGSLPHNIVKRITPIAHMSNGGPTVVTCCVMLCYFMLRYVMLCCVMLYCVMLCYVVSCYDILCCVVL